MKKIIYLVIMLFGASLAKAQITITSADAPQPGDMFVNAHDTVVDNLYPGESGENVVWDFSMLQSDKIDTTYIVEASQVDNNNEYPEATIAEILPQDTLFLQTTTDALTLIGERNKLYWVKFDDPIKGLQFPLTYGTTFQDDGHFLFYSPYDTTVQGVHIDSVKLERNYSLHDTCIAYGTLKLPGITYNDVLMVKEHMQIHEYLAVCTQWGWYDVEDTNYTVVRYDVYQNGYGSQLLDLLLNDDGTVKSATYKNTNNNPVNTVNTIELSIYPNPVQNNLYIDTPTDNSEVSIINNNGKILKQGSYSSKHFNIDVSTLNSGTYTIKVKTPQGIAVKKFIKE
jgi:hypothetical protein